MFLFDFIIPKKGLAVAEMGDISTHIFFLTFFSCIWPYVPKPRSCALLVHVDKLAPKLLKSLSDVDQNPYCSTSLPNCHQLNLFFYIHYGVFHVWWCVWKILSFRFNSFAIKIMFFKCCMKRITKVGMILIFIIKG